MLFDQVPDELLVKIVEASWDCAGFVCAVDKRLCGVVKRKALSYRRRVGAECAFYSLSCLQYGEKDRALSSVLTLGRKYPWRGPTIGKAQYCHYARMKCFLNGPVEVIEAVVGPEWVSMSATMLRSNRVDLLRICRGKEPLETQLRALCNGPTPGADATLQYWPELLLSAACKADSFVPMQYLWAVCIGYETQFSAWFNTKHSYLMEMMVTLGRSHAAGSIATFIVHRIVHTNRMEASEAIKIVVKGMHTVSMSKSAWQWIINSCKWLGVSVRKLVDNGVLDGWPVVEESFRDAEAFEFCAECMGEWPMNDYCGHWNGLGMSTLYKLVQRLLASTSSLVQLSEQNATLLQSCAWKAMLEVEESGVHSLYFATKVFMAMLDLSTTIAYKLCMRAAKHTRRTKIDVVLYDNGFLYNTLLRCAALNMAEAMDEATQPHSGINFDRFSKDQLISITRETIMARRPEQLGHICRVHTNYHESYVWEATGNLTCSCEMFAIVLRSFPQACNHREGGLAATTGNSPATVQVALDHKCFIPGSLEERQAFNILSTAPATPKNKRRLPWPPAHSKLAHVSLRP